MNTQDSKAQCSCGSAPKFIFPCSGASDVGGLSDQAARQMTKEGTGKMYCLAGILDNTPLLDIKPYIPAFDAFEAKRIGWCGSAQGGSVAADGRFAAGEA
jgi:hypothetical protein